MYRREETDMENPQRHIVWKKLLPVVCIIVLITIVLHALTFTSFQSLGDSEQVQSVLTDALGHYYILTRDHELFIGGINGDRFGFYDTDFRWGIIYGLRNLFVEREPVLFAKGVSTVFPCEYGVLYSELDGSLYYFGELSRGKLEKVAEGVLAACGTRNELVYIDHTHTAYYTSWDRNNSSWRESVYISESISNLYISGNCLWLLFQDGHVSTVSTVKNSRSFFDPEIVDIANDVERMWNGPFITVLQEKDGSYLLVFREDLNFPVVHKMEDWNAYSSNPDRIVADMDLKGPFPGEYLLSQQGDLYQLKNLSPVLAQHIEGDCVIDFAVNGEQMKVYSVDYEGNLLVEEILNK